MVDEIKENTIKQDFTNYFEKLEKTLMSQEECFEVV